jgi:hypothetical protein
MKMPLVRWCAFLSEEKNPLAIPLPHAFLNFESGSQYLVPVLPVYRGLSCIRKPDQRLLSRQQGAGAHQRRIADGVIVEI